MTTPRTQADREAAEQAAHYARMDEREREDDARAAVTTPRTTERRVRYHIVTVFPGISEPELNAYADRGWRVVAVDGDRVIFEERLDGSGGEDA